VALISKNLDKKHDNVKWLVNARSIHTNFNNIPWFDESLRYYGPSLHLVGGKSF